MKPNEARVHPQWLPSLTAWLWFIFLAVLCTAEWREAMVSADGDTYMHWASGEWMLQHRQLLNHDVFSHTHPGEPIISKEWLTQLLFAVAGRWDGLAGVALVGALLIATTFAWLHRQMITEGSDLLIATGLTILATWAAVTHWIARPHLFTLLLLVPWNVCLRRYQNGKTSRTTLLLTLALLTGLWVNLHGAFLVGFFTLGCYWLGAVVERDWQKVRTYTLTGLLCGFASLANPAGYQLHLHNLTFVRNKFFTGWLAEYTSTNFHNAAFAGFLLLLFGIILTLALLRPRFAAHEMILLIAWGYFALYSVRNIPIFAVLVTPILAAPLTAVLPARWRARTQPWLALRGWPAVIVAAAAFIVFIPRPTAMPTDKFPVAAVAFIKNNPADFTGPMFNQYLWGGYLLVALPEHKVFVDGRADFYGEALVREFDDTTHLRPNWYDALEKHHVTWTLMPTAHELNRALPLKGWRQIYRDETATIYRR